MDISVGDKVRFVGNHSINGKIGVFREIIENEERTFRYRVDFDDEKDFPCVREDIEKVETEDMDFSVGDEIWFKREGENIVFHRFVHTVKENVLGTVLDEKYHCIGKPNTWWELDNIRIIEVEKHDN